MFDLDRESVPMFVYDLNELTRDVLLTDRLLFTVCGSKDQVWYCSPLIFRALKFDSLPIPVGYRALLE